VPQIKNRKILIALSLTAIFVASLFIRLYRLDKYVPNLYADEVYGGFISKIIFSTSVQNIPGLITKLLYGMTHFSWLFGLTPIGTRFGSALFGSFIPLVIFFFTYAIAQKINPSKNLLVAFICSIFSAVLPWSFMISRVGHTHIPIIVLLCCLHLTILLKAQRTTQYLYSLIPLVVGVIFYPSFVVIAPMASLLVFVLITNGLNRSQRKIWWLFLTVVIVILGFVGITRYQLFNPKSRGLDLAIWKDVNVTADSNYYRGLSRLSEPTIFSLNTNSEVVSNKILYNYPLSIIRVFTKNYLSFFSPDFLFLKGDNILRHSTGMVGEFFPFLLPFMLIGAFVFFKKADFKLKSIFIVWILISPIPGAITKDGATYLLRIITLMPFLTYFCGQGIVSSLDLIKNKYMKVILGLFVALISLFSIYQFLFSYFHVYPALSASHWEYGFKEISDFQVTNPGEMLIIWEDKYPVWYFCFWQTLPSEVCDPKKINTSELVNSTRVDLPLENLLFSLPQTEKDLNLIISKYNPKYIALPLKYSDKYSEFVKNGKIVDIILYPDQTTAITIYKVNN